MRLSAVYFAIALSAANFAATVDAQEYPNRPVHVLAAAAPGGNPDVLARLLSQRLAEVLGQPFVVENVPGAGGILAAKRIAEASPDGYLLMLNDSGALAININMSADATYKLKDFTPITALATVPTALVIIPSVPANGVGEFIALAKSKPGAMSFGSAGAGSIHHLTMEIFAERTGIKLLHVPYRGGTALVNGLLTGEIQAGWSGLPNVIAHIKAGTLRGLCVSVLRRAVSLPDVPTCDEAGIKGYEASGWYGLYGPRGLPKAIADKVSADVRKVVHMPDTKERFASFNLEPIGSTPEEFAAFLKVDLEKYAKIAKAAKIEPQ